MYALCTPSVCVCMMFGRSQSNKVKCRAVVSALTVNKQEHCSFFDSCDGDDGCETSEKDEFDFAGRFALVLACVTQF